MGCVAVDNGITSNRDCCKTLLSIRQWMENRFNWVKYLGCFVIKNVKGTSTASVHSDGRAIDMGLSDQNNPLQNAAMWQMVNLLVANHCAIGLQRIIFDGKVWNASLGVLVGPGAWSSLSGSADQHRNHAHIEVSPAWCDAVSYQQLLAILADPIAPSAAPDPVAVASNPNPPSPVAGVGGPAYPPQADASGGWNSDNAWGANDWAASQTVVSDRLTAITCGGAGAYLVNLSTGQVFGNGLAVSYGDLGGPVRSFVPYGRGYYALLSNGTVVGRGYDADAIVVTGCPAPPGGYWQTMRSPRPGELVLSASSNVRSAAYQSCTVKVRVPTNGSLNACC